MHTKSTDLEEILAMYIKAFDLPKPERDFRFHDVRRWRLTFAWPDVRIAADIEASETIQEVEKDCEKYNCAIEYGWKVFRFTGDMDVRFAHYNECSTGNNMKNQKVFKLLHTDGRVLIVDDMPKFCQDTGLDKRRLRNTRKNGRVYCGWRVLESCEYNKWEENDATKGQRKIYNQMAKRKELAKLRDDERDALRTWRMAGAQIGDE